MIISKKEIVDLIDKQIDKLYKESWKFRGFTPATSNPFALHNIYEKIDELKQIKEMI